MSGWAKLVQVHHTAAHSICPPCGLLEMPQREQAGGTRVVVGSQPDLLEVVGALDAAGGISPEAAAGKVLRSAPQ